MARRQSKQEGLNLPDEIIQHIQSFMKYKESTQTSLLSKSWYKAWSTQPNLSFSSRDFSSTRFLDFVVTLVDRYFALNLKVDKLSIGLDPGPDIYDAFSNLIVDALKLRVGEIELVSGTSYLLPEQVFAHKYLTKLHLHRCEVGHLIPGNVLCSNLRSLALRFMSMDDSTFKDILVRCPNIEHLSLYALKKSLTRISATELQNLKTLILEFTSIGSPAITPSVIYGRFLNVSRMTLSFVSVEDSFFENLSSSFPKLEDLTLHCVTNYYREIASLTIKRLSLTVYDIYKMAHVDVPNIRYFEFHCAAIPDLSFRPPTANEWKSQITFTLRSRIIDLSKLRDFLVNLGQPKITLILNVSSADHVYIGRNIEISCLPVVEQLKCSVIRSWKEYDLCIECLMSCRPKLVSLIFTPGTITIPVMYEKLTERRNQNSINDLKEVDVQFFEDSVKQWQTIKVMSNDLEVLNRGADVLRFKLTWGSFSPEQTIIKLQYYG